MYMTTAAKGNNKTLFSAHTALSAAHDNLSLHHAGAGNDAYANGDKEAGARHHAQAEFHKQKAISHAESANSLYTPGVDKKDAGSKVRFAVGRQLFRQSPDKARGMIDNIHKTMGTGSKNMQQGHLGPSAPNAAPDKSKQTFFTPKGAVDGNGKKVTLPPLGSSSSPKKSSGPGLYDSKGNRVQSKPLSAPSQPSAPSSGLFNHHTGQRMSSSPISGQSDGKSLPAATAHYAKSHAHQALADHHQERADHHQTMADTHKAVGHSLNPAPASQHGSMFAKVGKLFKKSVGNKVSGAANFLKNTANKGHQAIHSYLDKKLAA